MNRIILILILLLISCSNNDKLYSVEECDIHINNLIEQIEFSKSFRTAEMYLELNKELVEWQIKKQQASKQKEGSGE